MGKTKRKISGDKLEEARMKRKSDKNRAKDKRNWKRELDKVWIR